MQLPLGNPIKSHQEFLPLQLMLLSKRFDNTAIFHPWLGGCSKAYYVYSDFALKRNHAVEEMPHGNHADIAFQQSDSFC